MNILTLNEDAAALLGQWREARGTQTLPTAKFIDPLKLRQWVGDVSVVHLHEGERRFHVALHGANVVRHFGPDFHQKYLEDVVPPTALTETLAPYELSIETKQPTYSIQHKTQESGLYKALERMILPCSLEDPENVRRFLIWVAPVDDNSPNSPSSFIRYDANKTAKNSSNFAELYLLSEEYASTTDDP